MRSLGLAELLWQWFTVVKLKAVNMFKSLQPFSMTTRFRVRPVQMRNYENVCCNLVSCCPSITNETRKEYCCFLGDILKWHEETIFPGILCILCSLARRGKHCTFVLRSICLMGKKVSVMRLLGSVNFRLSQFLQVV